MTLSLHGLHSSTIVKGIWLVRGRRPIHPSSWSLALVAECHSPDLPWRPTRASVCVVTDSSLLQLTLERNVLILKSGPFYSTAHSVLWICATFYSPPCQWTVVAQSLPCQAADRVLGQGAYSCCLAVVVAITGLDLAQLLSSACGPVTLGRTFEIRSHCWMPKFRMRGACLRHYGAVPKYSDNLM